ncbi:MAG: ABC transporter permease [Bacteroidales bacterium]|nr:ABC transporter permease [Bacteroidales bacterium]
MGRAAKGLNVLREIEVSLRRKRVNTLLAMGGIFLGVFILLVCTGIYNAFMSGTLAESLKWDVSILRVTTDGNFAMEYDDLQNVEEKFPDSECTCADIPSEPGIIYASVSRSASAPVCFVLPDYCERMMLGLLSGRFINDRDVEFRRKVCVLGKNVSDKLFGEDSDPCGNVVETGGVCYTVVGRLCKPVAPIEIFGNEEDMMFIPYPAADDAYGLGGKISQMMVFFPQDADTERKAGDVRRFIKQIHGVEDNGYEVIVKDCTDPVRQWGVAFAGVKYLILIVGAGMIVAGLLNLFNIMLVSVMERREELGLRLCSGATPSLVAGTMAVEGAVMSSAAVLAATFLALFVIVAARALIRIELVGEPYISVLLCASVLLAMMIGGAVIGYLCIRKTVYEEVSTLLSKTE